MTIAEEIARIQTAKAALKTSINGKGGTLTNETLDDYPAAVDALPEQKPEETFSVTPTRAAQSVTPTSGKVFSGGTVQGIPAEYIVPSGAVTLTPQYSTPTRPDDTPQPIAQDVTSYATAYVNAPLYPPPPQLTETVEPRSTAQVITPPSGYYGIKRVDVGGVNRPIANKSISGHTATVTPVVELAEEDLSGEPVTVTPAELCSGTRTITDNGTVDVTEYASAAVSVPKAIPIDISTAAGMEAVMIAANIGKAYRYTGVSDGDYINGDIYIVEPAG